MKFVLSVFALMSIISISCDEESAGPSPLKLDYYLESYNLDGTEFKPEYKVEYTYDASGKLERYTFYGRNPNTDNLEEQRHFQFSHNNGSVSKIEGYNFNSADPYVVYVYTYLPDGKVSKISEQNLATQINGEANFEYSTSGKNAKVTYSYSNGGGFEYEYLVEGGNILSDKTTRGSQLCSDGTYTYDQSINPFSNLGYVDFVLQNVSVNNKLSEAINYVGCGFPSFTPDSFVYEYNDRGYPKVATTIYKPTVPVRKSEKRFFYK